GSSAAARPSGAGGDSDRAVIDDLVEVLGEPGTLPVAAGPTCHALGQAGDLAVAAVAQRDARPDVAVELVGGVVGRHHGVVSQDEPLVVVVGRQLHVADGHDPPVAVARDVGHPTLHVGAIAARFAAHRARDPEPVEAGGDPPVPPDA